MVCRSASVGSIRHATGVHLPFKRDAACRPSGARLKLAIYGAGSGDRHAAHDPTAHSPDLPPRGDRPRRRSATLGSARAETRGPSSPARPSRSIATRSALTPAPMRSIARSRSRPARWPGSPARPDRHRAGRGDRPAAAMGRPAKDRLARPLRPSGRRGLRRADRRRHRCPADDRDHRGAYQPAGDPPAHRCRRHRPGRRRRARQRRDPRHQGGDRPGLASARHRRAVRRRRGRTAPHACSRKPAACSRSW